jgi:hypothetical protein
MKQKIKKKISQKPKRKSPLTLPVVVSLLDQGDDLDNLYNLFGVTDEQDILGVVDGSVGEINEDW